MMKKRRPFIIKDNFQLRFIGCFIAILIIGISVAAVLIYRSLAADIEQAAFSAHISFGSSTEIFWRRILEINLFVAILSFFILLVVIFLTQIALNLFFQHLADGLRRWERGDVSFRVTSRGRWFFEGIIRDFNLATESMRQRELEVVKLLEELIEIIDSNDQSRYGKILSLHKALKQEQSP